MPVTALYPNSYPVFTVNQDNLDVVEADDVNKLQVELSALLHIIGLTPQVSTAFPVQATVAARLAALDGYIETLRGYFTGGGGNVTQTQVISLSSDLTTIRNDISNLQAAGGSTASNSGLSNEITNRQNADATEVAARQNAITVVTNALNSEINNRAGAVNTESIARTGADNAQLDLISELTYAMHKHQVAACRTSALNVATSASWQTIAMPSLLTDPGGGQFTLTQYTDIGQGSTPLDAAGVFKTFGLVGPWCMTASVTIDGSGGTADVGVRGIRIITSGGTTLAAMIRPAMNMGGADDQLTVSWNGFLRSDTPTYYVYVQILQNSGGTLQVRAHAPTTPTYANLFRIPSRDITYSHPAARAVL